MKYPRAAFLAVLATGCGGADEPSRPPPRPAAPLTLPKTLCVGEPTPAKPCRRPAEVERWLGHPDLEILGTTSPPAGIQGARVLTLRVPGRQPVIFRAKWRAQSTWTVKNDPRRELVAYAIQRIYLEPHEYVVPPTGAHCFPLEVYRARVMARARPTFRDVPCVLGYLSYWLENVESPKDAGREGWFDWEGDAFDDDLFEKNPIYRDSVANMNLLTHLIDHADTHSKQFLIARNPDVPVVYSVDNSMSFGVKKNTRVRVDWSEIRVPALSRRHTERLRSATAAIDALASIAEFEPTAAGTLIPVPPELREPVKTGITWRQGRLVIGLKAAELDRLRERLTQLFIRIDRGELKLY